MRPIQPYNPFLPQPSQIPAEFACPDLCRTPQFSTSISIPNPSSLIPNCTYTFSAKERDPETGLSYFGSRYYSSDLSIWLNVDPQSAKYPSLSPYVYCANNPVRLVDPNGEEVSNPDDPPKRNFFQKIGDGFVKFDKSLEGHSDGANQGTITKQDVEVGIAVVATMSSVGTAMGAEKVVEAGVAIASAVNSIDDATVNSAGQTVSQRASSNNPVAKSTVNATKQTVSVVATGHSGYTAFSSVKTAVQKGGKEIQKAATKVVSAATNLVGTIRSFFKKK